MSTVLLTDTDKDKPHTFNFYTILHTRKLMKIFIRFLAVLDKSYLATSEGNTKLFAV